jgi:hypothetical protein
MRKLCFSKRQNESVELEIVLFDNKQKQIYIKKVRNDHF